jgi:imidazoleglycerol-phosphate dehydratase / histidinol-phosphatase
MSLRKILFVDRDGCLIAEPADYQIDSIEKLEFLPGVFSALSRIQSAGYELVMVTNQDGLGTDSFPEADFWPAHNLMLKTFSSQGICFAEICIDRHFPHEASDTRKPKIGMVLEYLRSGFDVTSSAMVGDRVTDMQFAANLGVRGLRIGQQHAQDPKNPDSQNADALSYQSASDWLGIAALLLDAPRIANVQRNTRETKIKVAVNLDATAPLRAHTGIGFFDHMLEQLGKHGGFSLSLDCVGDLEIDEHHTIEDCALALGQALKIALGDKRGIARYAFVLPMDETLVQAELNINQMPTVEPVSLAALDLSGRPYFVFDGQIDRKYVGAFPTELFPHFFRSLCETLGANLRLKVQGENDHHQIEASFKAVARCLRQAIARTGDVLPSTKGTL